MKRINRKNIAMLFAMCVLLLAFFFSGCALKMAITEKTKILDLTKETIVLITVKTSNNYKPIYQPNVYHVRIFTVGKEDEEDCYTFRVKKPYNKVENQFNEYLISIKLPPGNYELKEITGEAGDGVFVSGSFTIPLYIKFDLNPDKIFYCGRIEASNRKRVYDYELRAGPVIPLLDQVLTGFSTGTFDVTIYDNYEEDLAIFKQNYPVITDYNVEKMILTPRKKALEEE